MKKTNQEKLIPCSCGGKARLINEGANWFKGIECRKCGLNIYFFYTRGKYKGQSVGFVDGNPNAVIKAWNAHVSKIQGR